MAPDNGGPFSVLFVCTGNICRSPTAEALARRELERYPGVPIQVSSAGSHALEGTRRPAAPCWPRPPAAPTWSGTSPAS
jgi:hypothetical protein